jgi:hypothetical protein
MLFNVLLQIMDGPAVLTVTPPAPRPGSPRWIFSHTIVIMTSKPRYEPGEQFRVIEDIAAVR